MNTLKNINKTNLLLLIFAFISFLLFIAVNGNDYWLDEIYTFYTVKNNSFLNIYYQSKMDVHPPLYYFLLKAFVSIFGNKLIVFKIFSLLPIAILVLAGIYPIKRLFGEKTSITFTVLLLLFPITQYLATEIRMYSWTFLMITLSAVYLYDFYINNSLKSIILVLLFSICSCYLHNYGFVSIGIIYGLFTVYLIYNKEWKVLKKLIFIISIIFICYLPWIFNLSSQIKSVSKDYWVPNVDFPTLKSFIIYYFLPTNPLKNKIVPIICFLLFVFYSYIILKPLFFNKLNSKRIKFSIFLVLTIIFIFIFSLTFSLVIKPIFVDRYFSPLLGLYILSLSISISLIDDKKTQRLFYISLIFLAMLSIYKLYLKNLERNTNNKIRSEINHFINNKNIKMETTFICDDYMSMIHFYNKYLALELYNNKINKICISPKNIDNKTLNTTSVSNINFLPYSDNIFYIKTININDKIFTSNMKSLKTKYTLSDSIYIKENYAKIYYLIPKK